MASILSTFDIEKAVDDAGNVIEPEMKINPDLPTLQYVVFFGLIYSSHNLLDIY